MSLLSRALDALGFVFGPPRVVESTAIEIARTAEPVPEKQPEPAALAPADPYNFKGLVFPEKLEVAGKMKDEDWMKVLEKQSENFEATYAKNNELQAEIAALKTKNANLERIIVLLGGHKP